MAILTGVTTSDGRAAFAKSFGKRAGFSGTHAAYFRMGVGGYVELGGGRSPKAPDPALHDIESVTSSLYYFEKQFGATDLVFVSPSIMQVRCKLDGIESNDDGSGNEPKFFELGIFDDQGVLVAYTTFPEQTKASNKILTNYVQCYF